MKLKDSFSDLEKIRKQLGADISKFTVDSPIEPLEKIEIRLATDGIRVQKEDVIKDIVGPYLTYQGQSLAILYIYDTGHTHAELIKDNADKPAPKFHFCWCSTLENMYANKWGKRYFMSRAADNHFRVEATEWEEDSIEKYGKTHELKGIRLFPCQNCLVKLSYKDFHWKWQKDKKLEAVSNFQIQEYIDENEGNLAVMKFVPSYDENSPPSGIYTDDFPQISTKLRASVNWKCSKCNVDMSLKKAGLHTHHRNRVKSNNAISNLQVLCALCHKNIDRFHSNMPVKASVERYILSNRPNTANNT